MFPDTYILERRLRQLQRLPWAIPAGVIMQMTDEDFDRLDMAGDTAEWWRCLNEIVTKITDRDKEAACTGRHCRSTPGS
jgi:hypothetical protein